MKHSRNIAKWNSLSTDNFLQFYIRLGEKSLSSWSDSTTTWNSWRLQCGTSMSDSFLISRLSFHWDSVFLKILVLLWSRYVLTCYVFSKIYPHRFAGVGGTNPAQVSICTFYRSILSLKNVVKTSPKCLLLFTEFLHPLSAALPLPWFHQILHSSATRQTECGNRKCCLCFFPFSDYRHYCGWKNFNYCLWKHVWYNKQLAGTIFIYIFVLLFVYICSTTPMTSPSKG